MSKSWDKTAIEVVRAYAKRSHCVHYKVGAAYYKGKRLLTVGYNGPPRGEPHCDEVGCAKETDGRMLSSGSGECIGAHAEMNAIVNAAAVGTPALEGSRVYCTYSPCYDCAKHLRNLGITEFIFEKDYDGKDAEKAFSLFKRHGIKIRKFEEEGNDY